MLHHRTTDPALRAEHIATREADLAYQKIGGSVSYLEILCTVYEEALTELLGLREYEPQPTD